MAVRAANEYIRWAEECRPLRVASEHCTPIGRCSEPRLVDDIMADEDSGHKGWIALHLGALNYIPEGIGLPERVALYGSADGVSYTLLGVTQPYAWPNNRHDAWVNELSLEHKGKAVSHLQIVLTCPTECYIDELRLSGSKE